MACWARTLEKVLFHGKRDAIGWQICAGLLIDAAILAVITANVGQGTEQPVKDGQPPCDVPGAFSGPWS